MIANRKENKDWLWEEFLKLAIKERKLKGEDESKFREKPNYHWLRKTAINLFPDCDSDKFKNPKLGHPPPVSTPRYQYYPAPRAKKPKAEGK